ncbi:Mitochondrial import inner membrane translocase subunit tim22 [Hanseniaspora valbyensis]
MPYEGFSLELASPPPPDRPLSELTPEEQGEKGAEMIIGMMTSCPGKSAISGVAGFGLGGVFGLFMASMSYDTPLHTPQVAGSTQGGKLIVDLPFKEQMKVAWKDMYTRAWSSAKNFGYIGLIYAGVECCVESTRGKSDHWNGLSAGCLTGGGLAYKSGPQAAAIGCASFAAFSAAIDLYMNSENGKPPKNDFDE